MLPNVGAGGSGGSNQKNYNQTRAGGFAGYNSKNAAANNANMR